VTRHDQKAIFECELSHANLKVTWMKDNSKLLENNSAHSPDNRIRAERDGYGRRAHRLVIEHVNWDDVGQYTAFYSDDVHTTAGLSVRCKSRISALSLFTDWHRVNKYRLLLLTVSILLDIFSATKLIHAKYNFISLIISFN